jgi:hypothetical protein
VVDEIEREHHFVEVVSSNAMVRGVDYSGKTLLQGCSELYRDALVVRPSASFPGRGMQYRTL